VACLSSGLSLSARRHTSAGGLGSNVIVNGTFDVDANWTKASGWSIAAGVATITAQGGTRDLRQNAVPMVDGANYEVTFTVSGYVSGTVTAGILGSAVVSGTPRSANGTYTEILNAGSLPTSFRFRADINTALSVDNVTVREVY
jgi:hypothetical protein